MLPEYLKYWGLNRPPFSLTPDPEMLYMSRQHQEGLIRLKYAVVSNKGGALLISESAGDGKTSLLAKLRKELDEYYQGNCRVVFIDHPTVTANQMVGEIARQLGVGAHTTDKLVVLNELRAFLLQRHEQGEKCVVMLDEGQMLCHRPDLLQELRILLNFCVSDAFLLTFILSGQKPLDGAIRAMPEFYQRLPVRFFLRNLDMDDSRELIRFRLQVAGCEQGREIFSEDGYAGIFNHSKGCPRVICSVADLSLVIAHSRFADKVDFVSVSQATSDMNRTDGAYHYFHFLNSFKNMESSGVQNPQLSGQPALTCPACNSQIQPDASFCIHCGYALKVARDLESEARETAIRPQAQAEPAATGHAEQVLPPEAGTEAPASQELPAPKAKKKPEVSSPAMFSFDEDRHEDPGANLQRAIRFILEGESDKPAPAEARPQQLAEQITDENPKEENGEVAEAAPETNIQEISPETSVAQSEQSVSAAEEKPTTINVDSADEQEQEQPAVEQEPEIIKCGFCGLELTPETAECPNCGESLKPESDQCEEDDTLEHAEEEPDPESKLQEPAPEDELLDGLRELKLDKFISADKERLDNGTSELLRLPCPRFWGRSPVVQFIARDTGEFFTSRCGVRIGCDRLLLETGGDTDSLAYEMIEQIGTDAVSNDGTVLLGQLVITATEGTYRLTLPFNADIGGRLAGLLESYIGGRIPSAAHSEESQSNQQGSEDGNGNGHN